MSTAREAWQTLIDNKRPLDDGPASFLGPEMCRELIAEALKASIFGKPIQDLDRDELLVTIGWLSREAKKGYAR